MVLPAGFAFRLTLTRGADAPPADVAVSDWMDLVVTHRTSTGERLPAKPGDFARIGSGETWTYDVVTTVRLAPGQGPHDEVRRVRRWARGWTVTFAELDAAGVASEAGETHTF